MPKKKRITGEQLLGQQGVNLIEKVVLSMGFTWTPTGALEAGIDGYIELRDHGTGDMSNCIIQVQSKATNGAFQSESSSAFSYSCKPQDVTYWTSGNAPVIIVVSRPSTNEAYWVDAKAYFALHPETKTIRFSKIDDRFDVGCAPRLLALGVDQASGLYLPPPPKREQLVLSMVQVKFRPKWIWSAPALYPTAKETVAALKAAKVYVPREWAIDGGRLYAWDMLHEGEWGLVVDQSDVKPHPVERFASTSDPATRQIFVKLLYRTLPSCLQPNIRQRVVDGKHLSYFGPFRRAEPRIYRYKGPRKEATQTVVRVEMKRDHPDEVYYHRCHAAQFSFREFGGAWYLDITPTYYFSTDGWDEHPHAKWLASGIKQIEGQGAILGQLRLWVALLRQEADLLNQHERVFEFSEALAFESELGFDEATWRIGGDEEDAARDHDAGEEENNSELDEAEQMSLFGGQS